MRTTSQRVISSKTYSRLDIADTARSRSECAKGKDPCRKVVLELPRERPMRLWGELNRSASQKAEIHRYCRSVRGPQGNSREIRGSRKSDNPSLSLGQDNPQEITRTPELALKQTFDPPRLATKTRDPKLASAEKREMAPGATVTNVDVEQT